VNEANANASKAFEGSTHNTFQIIHMASDENLAYWVGIQRSVVKMRGQEQAVPMDLRVTEIFRREAGLWKLIHRHADRLVSAAQARGG
jgi:ketosteroid isomerase-like protein